MSGEIRHELHELARNPVTERRHAEAWELLAAGYEPAVFDWLPLIARREMLPAVAKIADGMWSAVRVNFNVSQLQEIADAIHAEERVARKAEKRGEKASGTPANGVAAWLRGELAEYEPRTAWGILCLIEMNLAAKENPDLLASAGKLYRTLRGENYSPNDIIKLARVAQRKARQLDTDSTDSKD